MINVCDTNLNLYQINTYLSNCKFQKTVIFVVTAVRTWDVTNLCWLNFMVSSGVLSHNMHYVILPVSITVHMWKYRLLVPYQRWFYQTRLTCFRWYKWLFSLNIDSHSHMYVLYDYHCSTDCLYSELVFYAAQSGLYQKNFDNLMKQHVLSEYLCFEKTFN